MIVTNFDIINCEDGMELTLLPNLKNNGKLDNIIIKSEKIYLNKNNVLLNNSDLYTIDFNSFKLRNLKEDIVFITKYYIQCLYMGEIKSLRLTQSLYKYLVDNGLNSVMSPIVLPYNNYKLRIEAQETEYVTSIGHNFKQFKYDIINSENTLSNIDSVGGLCDYIMNNRNFSLEDIKKIGNDYYKSDDREYILNKILSLKSDEFNYIKCYTRNGKIDSIINS